MLTKTKIETLFAALVLLAAAASAHAGGPPAPAAATADLARLVGTWKGTGSMTMGSEKADGIQVTWNCRAISARAGVACDGVMTGIPGVDRYEETDLFGYDPGAGTVHWFAVTNAGETHDHVGGAWTGLSTDHPARFVYTGTQDGKPLKEVIELSLKGTGGAVLEVHAQTFVAGKLASGLQVTAHK
ncbi:MAG TPA: hypothetical protein VHM31_20135 [Polyangia bacterium]|nr:hypothetical protein [Polyangia bacterium]